ncbi:hypothetical protein DL96DRAFT_1824361 [Flagelloscypha sp. PMI_526]|nr:hypothetical protein DL96DRAFT_1824361 [Flagelloscypha sp. PMI_526]
MNEPRNNGLKVLTFDGEADIRVGVQSSLYTLLDMMRRAAYSHPELTAGETNANSSSNSIPEALPCKCFDLIVGSGDGGWIAIMLGRLHMSTSQVIRTYLQVRTSVHDSYPYNGPGNTWNPDAMSTAFENQLKLIVINRDEGADETFQVQTPSCHVVALAVHKESDAPYAACFRNYVTRIDSLPNCTTWFAMRAVASSMLFPPALMSSTGQKFVSAAQLNFNNPVFQAISEAIHLAKRLNITNPPLACLVSLGAGHPGVREIDISELGNTAIHLTQGAELAHRQVQERLQTETNLSGSKAMYFRVNVDQGFQTDLSQQITSAEIYTHSKTYLQQPEIEDRMNEIVKHILGASEGVTTFIPLVRNVLPDIQMTSAATASFPTRDPLSKLGLMHIYANGLYPKGYGLPVWNPQPFEKVIDVGDLGFINHNGGFETLFNITVPATQQNYYSLPPEFKPFAAPHIKKDCPSIEEPYLESGICVECDAQLRIPRRLLRGAILIPKEMPSKLFITQSQPLVDYIAEHHEQWYQFLKGHNDCPAEVINASKLLVVTGVHRTSNWSLGAWSCTLAPRSISCTTHDVLIGWQPDPAPGIRSGLSSPNQRHAPIHDFSAQNVGTESLFIEGYRISRRDKRHKDLRTGISVFANDTTLSKLWDLFMGITSIGGSSDGQDQNHPAASLPSPPPTSRYSSIPHLDSLQVIGSTELPRHPLDNLVDLAVPDIQTAIIHDHDWLRLAQWTELSLSRIKQKIKTYGTCGYFEFPSPKLPLADVGPLIASYVIQLGPAAIQSLSLTNKQLHEIIQLSQAEKLGCLLDTISSNPSIACHVEKFCVENVAIPWSAEFKYCHRLSTLALFSFCLDTTSSNFVLPPSVTRLACDPAYLASTFTLSENAPQALTHLHLLTKLPTTQLWNWLGLTEMPVLTHLAIEHHLDASLEDVSQELIPLVKKYLSEHIKLCVVLLVMRDQMLRYALNKASITLSDGTVDERVVLATTSRPGRWNLGYLLSVHMYEVRRSWINSSPNLWTNAESVLRDRKMSGIFPREYYSLRITTTVPPHRGIRVLTLDGENTIQSGVSSALETLRLIMHRVSWKESESNGDRGTFSHSDGSASDDEALPCNYFDIIVGSGDGGWIAVMLGRLRLSVSQTIEAYQKIHSAIHHSKSPLSTKQKSIQFESMLKDFVKKRCKDANELLLDPEAKPKCRVVLLAMTPKNMQFPIIFRSYKSRRHPQKGCKIWEAIRVSAAVPGVHLPYAIEGQTYIAASEAGHCNPIETAIKEVKEIFPNDKLFCVISLGSGHPGHITLQGSDLMSIAETTLQLVRDAERVSDNVRSRLNIKEQPRVYFRFNVDQGLQHYVVSSKDGYADAWSHSMAYFQQQQVDMGIDEAVDCLCPHPSLIQQRAIIRNNDSQQLDTKQKSAQYPVTFKGVGKGEIGHKSSNEKGTKSPNTATSISAEATMRNTVQLNNYLQAANRLNVLSWTTTIKGDDHAPIHTCLARIHGQVRGTGKATQKNMAKDKAALQALKWLRANEGKW